MNKTISGVDLVPGALEEASIPARALQLNQMKMSRSQIMTIR